jgi:hypothetical protein
VPDLPPSEDVLRIRELELELAVCGDRQQATSAKARLDRLLATELGRIGARAMEPLRRKHDGIWFVRSLVFETDLDLELVDAALAGAWTAQLVAAVSRRLIEPDPNEVRHFADRKAYLAAFLVDRARGVAWNAWYYAAFDGLSALPVSAALRTAVLAEPRLGADALRDLSRVERVDVLSALGPSDARRVLEGLAASSASGARPSRELVRSLASFARFDQAYLAAGEPPWRLALGIHVELLAAHPEVGPGELARLACAAAFLVSLGLPERVAFEPGLRAPLLDAGAAELYRSLGVQGAEWLPYLLALDAELRRELVEAVLSAEAESVVRDEPRFTRYGGIFLLFPSLARFELEAARPTWAEPPGGDQRSALRLLVLAQCLSPGAPYDLLRDPVTRDLCAVPGTLDTRELEAWLTRVEGRAHVTAAAEWVLADFARRLPGFNGSSAAYLRRNFLDLRASLTPESHRFVVRLERAPLNAILAMTGLVRARYALPWLVAVPLELYQESSS